MTYKEITLAHKVTEFFGLFGYNLFEKTTNRRLIEARQVYMFLLKQIRGKRNFEIAKIMGCDHATVHYSINRIHGLFYSKDKKIYDFINEIINEKNE